MKLNKLCSVTGHITQCRDERKEQEHRRHLSPTHLASNIPLPVRLNFTYIPFYLWEINNTIRRRYRFLIKSGPELNGRHCRSRKKVMEAHRTGLEIFTNASKAAAPRLCAASGGHITSPTADSRRPFFYTHMYVNRIVCAYPNQLFSGPMQYIPFNST